MGADPHPAVQVVTAFWDGLEAREFWVTCAGEEPPAWRAHLTQRYDGLLAPTSVE